MGAYKSGKGGKSKVIQSPWEPWTLEGRSRNHHSSMATQGTEGSFLTASLVAKSSGWQAQAPPHHRQELTELTWAQPCSHSAATASSCPTRHTQFIDTDSGRFSIYHFLRGKKKPKPLNSLSPLNQQAIDSEVKDVNIQVHTQILILSVKWGAATQHSTELTR